MHTSEQIGELATALAKAQGNFVNLGKNRTVRVKTKTGGEYSFSYATFDECISMVRPRLAEQGLAIVQSIEIEMKGEVALVCIETRLIHTSGQWISTKLLLVPEDDTPQCIGSAATYGKRYSLSAMLGLASDEDDDGAHASGHRSTPQPRTAPAPAAKAPAKQTAATTGRTPAQQIWADFCNRGFASGEITPADAKEALEKHKGDYAAAQADIERQLKEANELLAKF